MTQQDNGNQNDEETSIKEIAEKLSVEKVTIIFILIHSFVVFSNSTYKMLFRIFFPLVFGLKEI